MKTLAAVLVLATTSLGFAREPVPVLALPAVDDERSVEAVLHGGRLVRLDEVGRIRVWELPGGTFDAATSTLLAHEGLMHLAARGESLFAAGKSTVWHWSDAARKWDTVASFEAGDEAPRALAVVGATPLLVFRRSVQSPLAGRTFEVPPLEGLGAASELGRVVVLGTESTLWIGTGYGEWGGHLLGLDVKTGAWSQYRDAFHCVTGLTQSSRDALIVTWSMRHRGNRTLLREHGLDGAMQVEFPELDGKSFQSVAHSSLDAALYGVERASVVRIEDGAPRPLATLEGVESEPDRKAVGVAPDIAALLPFAPRSLAIVPKHGFPWLFRRGEVARLSVP